VAEPVGHQQLGAPPRARDRRAVLPGDLRVAAIVNHEKRRCHRGRQLDRIED
jgi:hypothetical protein